MKSCAQRGLSSALHLVSECSGIPKSDLEAMYRRETVGDFFDVVEEEDGEDQDLAEAAAGEEIPQAQESEGLQGVLKHIRDVATDEYSNQEEDAFILPKLVDRDAGFCEAAVIELAKDRGEAEPDRKFPHTLTEALTHPNFWAGRSFYKNEWTTCGLNVFEHLRSSMIMYVG